MVSAPCRSAILFELHTAELPIPMLSKLKSERTRFVILFLDVFSQNSLLTTLKVGLSYVFKMDFHGIGGGKKG